MFEGQRDEDRGREGLTFLKVERSGHKKHRASPPSHTHTDGACFSSLNLSEERERERWSSGLHQYCPNTVFSARFCHFAAVHPARQPITRSSRPAGRREGREDDEREKKRKTKAIDINDLPGGRRPPGRGERRSARYQLIAGGRGIRLNSD